MGEENPFLKGLLRLHLTSHFLHVSIQTVDSRKEIRYKRKQNHKKSRAIELVSNMLWAIWIGGETGVKFEVEQIKEDKEEAVVVCCHDTQASWVQQVKEAANGQISVCGYKNEARYRLRLSDIYYFEVVDGVSFFYTQKEVFTAKEKLYEFERISTGSPLFRCSKSMLLNADKIDYVRPSVSGRFEAILSNGESVMVSRKYVARLKQILGC